MFGYVRPQKPELLVKEYDQYKGVYCTLCKQLGKRYGILSRMTLSYDCTFLALFLLARSPQCPGFHTGRCVVNPLKKCTFCTGGEDAFAIPAALSVIMTYYKIRDDIVDSHFWGRIRAYCMLPLVSRSFKRASRKEPVLQQAAAEMMVQQGRAEQQKEISLDMCAEPMAQMLAVVFEHLEPEEEKTRRILHQFGYFLGRWIYLIDAADDLEKDIKKKAFNPFAVKFSLNRDSTEEQLADVRAYCNEVLNSSLSQAIAAVQLLTFQRFESILMNIITQGLPGMQEEMLFHKKEQKHVRSV